MAVHSEHTDRQTDRHGHLYILDDVLQEYSRAFDHYSVRSIVKSVCYDV